MQEQSIENAPATPSAAPDDQVAILKQRIRAMFLDRFQVEVESDSQDLINDGLLDSLIFVDLIMLLEQDFNVSVDMETVDFEDFRSVAQIVDFIGRK